MRFVVAILLALASAPASAQLSYSAMGYSTTGRTSLEAVPIRPQFQDGAAPTQKAAPERVARSPVVAKASLEEMVAAQAQSGDLSRELHCLAGATYFEARGESLRGQLAVARVIIARARSGRFPASYCGVVFQASQFCFIRGNAMPPIDQASQAWREAVAVARVADSGTWRSPAEGALFFHSVHVSPGWHRVRVARVENHVFYR